MRATAIGLGLLAAAWVVARAIPEQGAWLAALAAVLFATPIALFAASIAAAVRGHALGMVREGPPVRPLLAGPILRVVLAVAIGLVGGLWAAVRLPTAAPSEWLLLAAAAPAMAGAVGLTGRLASAHVDAAYRSLMALRSARWLVAGGVWIGLVLLAAAGLAPQVFPAEATSQLVAEAFAARAYPADLWARLQGVADQAGAPRAVLLLLGAAGDGLLAWWAASLAALPWLAAGDARRALMPASPAAPERLPPAVAGWAAAAATLFVVFVWLPLAAALETMLRDRPVSAAVEVARRAEDKVATVIECEIIGTPDRCHVPGTIDALEAERAEIAALPPETRRVLDVAVDQTHAAMLRGIDVFLDRFYSRPAEYRRLAAALTGDLKQRLEADIRSALEDALRSDPLEAVLRRAVAAEDAALVRAGERIAAICAAGRREVPEDARVEIVAGGPGGLGVPPGPGPGGPGRAAVGAGVGGVTGGRITGIEMDSARLKPEEALQRATFRAELVAPVDAWRDDMRAALGLG